MQRIEQLTASDTAELLRLHGLQGQAQAEVLQRVAQLLDVHTRLNEKGAAAWGGAVTGALAGLKAISPAAVSHWAVACWQAG